MTFNIPHLENKRPLEKNEATQQEETSARKKLKSGTQNGRMISQRESPFLQLPTEILGKIVRCVDWKSRDTLHLTLTCKKLKQITEARPHVRLAKVLTFLDRHPLNYFRKEVPKQLLDAIPSLLSAISVMPDDQLSFKDLKYFRVFTYSIAKTFLQIPFPPPLIPLIAQLIKHCDVSISDTRHAQLPAVLQEAYQVKETNKRAFKNLAKDAHWTRDKIEAINWSLLLRNSTEISSYYGRDLFRNMQNLFSQFSWWENIDHLYSQKPLPEVCLLVLLSYADKNENVAQIFRIAADKLNDPNFMLKALEITPNSFKSCSPKLKQDRSFLLQALKINGEFLNDFRPTNDLGILLAAAPSRKDAIQWRPDSSRFGGKIGPIIQKRLQTDKNFLLAFLKSFQPYVRKSLLPSDLFPPSFSLSPKLADDEELMKETIPYCEVIWQHASPRIKNSKEMALHYLQYRGEISAIPQELLMDEEIVTRYVETTGNLAAVLPPFRKRRDLALKAIEKNWRALSDVDDSLKEDKNFILAAANRNPLILLLPMQMTEYDLSFSPQPAPPAFLFLKKMIEELFQNRELVLRLIKTPKSESENKQCLCGLNIPQHFKNDFEILLEALKQDPKIIPHIDSELLAQENFINALFDSKPLNLDLMLPSEPEDQKIDDPMEIEISPAGMPQG